MRAIVRQVMGLPGGCPFTGQARNHACDTSRRGEQQEAIMHRGLPRVSNLYLAWLAHSLTEPASVKRLILCLVASPAKIARMCRALDAPT